MAPNVVPDRATCTLNHRFAPDRTKDEAYEWLVSFLEPVIERLFGDPDDVVGDKTRPFSRAVHRVLQATFPFEHGPAREIVGG